ncbi:hypothetical protein WICPIJ_006032 [Wickerhamomyces pijperi]|uniref:Uncharacterized protein n=1 Tax=Wickerhamomyces pijperi TaxID=599730 RepID=A0A9P8Q2J0_WICPI|nr:hypothetical protein WICPIJ_006032 [Wickerhamomyces pijperi]
MNHRPTPPQPPKPQHHSAHPHHQHSPLLELGGGCVPQQKYLEQKKRTISYHSKLQALDEKHAKLKALFHSADIQVSDLKEKLERDRVAFENKISDIMSQLEKERNSSRSLYEKVGQLQATCDSNMLLITHNQSIIETKEAALRDHDQYSRDLEKHIQSMKISSDASIAQLKHEYQSQIDTLKTQHESQIIQLKTQNTDLETTNQNLTARLEFIMKKNNSIKAELNQLKKEKSASKTAPMLQHMGPKQLHQGNYQHQQQQQQQTRNHYPQGSQQQTQQQLYPHHSHQLTQSPAFWNGQSTQAYPSQNGQFQQQINSTNGSLNQSLNPQSVEVIDLDESDDEIEVVHENNVQSGHQQEQQQQPLTPSAQINTHQIQHQTQPSGQKPHTGSQYQQLPQPQVSHRPVSNDGPSLTQPVPQNDQPQVQHQQQSTQQVFEPSNSEINGNATQHPHTTSKGSNVSPLILISKDSPPKRPLNTEQGPSNNGSDEKRQKTNPGESIENKNDTNMGPTMDQDDDVVFLQEISDVSELSDLNNPANPADAVIQEISDLSESEGQDEHQQEAGEDEDMSQGEALINVDGEEVEGGESTETLPTICTQPKLNEDEEPDDQALKDSLNGQTTKVPASVYITESAREPSNVTGDRLSVTVSLLETEHEPKETSREGSVSIESSIHNQGVTTETYKENPQENSEVKATNQEGERINCATNTKPTSSTQEVKSTTVLTLPKDLNHQIEPEHVSNETSNSSEQMISSQTERETETTTTTTSNTVDSVKN